MYVVKNLSFVFLLFTFPLLGWVLHEYFSKTILIVLLSTFTILLLPVFTSYMYDLDNAYGYIIYIILTSGYAFLIKRSHFRFWGALKLAAIIFPVCGFFSFLGVMLGSINVESEWKVKGYKVVYFRDQGFSGRALMTYQLIKYAPLSIFIKHIDTVVDDDTTHSCWIRFKDSKFNFNKCAVDSSYFNH